jgi:hypothetical protein
MSLPVGYGPSDLLGHSQRRKESGQLGSITHVPTPWHLSNSAKFRNVLVCIGLWTTQEGRLAVKKE